MKLSIERLEQLISQFKEEAARATSRERLEQLREAFLGAKGYVRTFRKMLGSLDGAERPLVGSKLQELERLVTEALDQRSAAFSITSPAGGQKTLDFDVTAYRYSPTRGGLHPYTHIIQRVEDIFISLGWDIAEGPEVEKEFYNFEALNIPAHHPARELHDTLWLDRSGFLLRTHTSSIEIRYMERHAPPLAVCAPGRVFRHEATDATHDFAFMQCEGLYVSRGVSLAHLISTLTTFMRLLFAKNSLEIRIRPSYFPFVEPGLEVDISCPFCTAGCAVCKKSRWIELGGAGLTHPHVLRACGLDPAEWSGFAFGFGIERIALLIYRMNDIRLFKSGKLTVLQQFS